MKCSDWLSRSSHRRSSSLLAGENKSSPCPLQLRIPAPNTAQRKHLCETRWLPSPASPASAWLSPPRSLPAAPVRTSHAGERGVFPSARKNIILIFYPPSSRPRRDGWDIAYFLLIGWRSRRARERGGARDGQYNVDDYDNTSRLQTDELKTSLCFAARVFAVALFRFVRSMSFWVELWKIINNTRALITRCAAACSFTFLLFLPSLRLTTTLLSVFSQASRASR